MTVSLDPMLEPRSVAVVGASADPGKAGNSLMRSLAHFEGPVYAVNPRAAKAEGGTVIEGAPVFADVVDLPEPPDLVIIAVPPAACIPSVASCAGFGVGAVVVCTGGMSESGGVGSSIESEMAAIARDAEMQLLGPNTSGLINPHIDLAATFVPAAAEVGPGNVSIVAQSGGVNHALIFELARRGAGVRIAVGTGNAAGVGEPELVRWLAGDPGTSCIALHVEGARRGRELFESVVAASRVKPVVVLKAGRTDVDRLAVSHTGSLTGSFATARAAFRQAGAVNVDSSEELVVAAMALASGRMPPRRSPGIGLVSGQAGPALLAADAIQAKGSVLPALSQQTISELREKIGPDTFLGNPVDTGRPDGESFEAAGVIMARDPAVDVVVAFALHEPGAMDAASVVKGIADRSSLPTLFGTGGPTLDLARTRQELSASGIAMFETAEACGFAASALAADSRARHRAAGLRGEHREISAGPGPFDENSAKSLIAGLDIPIPERRVCRDRTSAMSALLEIGPPVVAKILDPSISHKSEIGGVVADISTEGEMRSALARIDRAKTSRSLGYLIESQVPAGIDLIAGAVRDDQFGPIVLLGIGGVEAEALDDTAVRVAPISEADGIEMAGDLRASSLLDGFRGRPVVDRREVARVLLALGDLLCRNPHLLEVEINPLRATPEGLVCLDALVVTADERLK